MKQAVLLLSLLFLSAQGFSQRLPFDNDGLPFQRTNLVVRWRTPKNSWPKTLWVYRARPNMFSPAVISNLVALGGFVENERRDRGANTVFFQHDAYKLLQISFANGTVDYRDPPNFASYGPTNLTSDVPRTNELIGLMTSFLPKLGINVSELARKPDGGNLKIAFVEDEMLYYPNQMIVTNIPYRGVRFSRSVDGVELKEHNAGNEINWGERGKIIGISLFWPDLERVRSFSTAVPEKVINWLREGRAIYWPRYRNGSEIPVDWATVRRLTINKAAVYYWRSESGWIRPYLALWGVIDTSHGKEHVEIGCPVIDEGEQTD